MTSDLIAGALRWLHTRSMPSSRKSYELSRMAPLCEREARSIPDADFVSPAFDNDQSRRPSQMVVILSTPRCGSTYLCDLLRRAGLCTPHEYFQPQHYLPLLSYRWDCVENGRVGWRRYARALEKNRTSASGTLGIKVHGAHLYYFSEALPYFTAPATRYVWLQRRDRLRQAVSFGIARQTGQWTSHFRARGSPTYRYNYLRRGLNAIHSQEDLIAAFLYARGLSYETLYYEDLLGAARAQMLKKAFDIDVPQTRAAADPLAPRRQADALNETWLSRFARNMFFGT